HKPRWAGRRRSRAPLLPGPAGRNHASLKRRPAWGARRGEPRDHALGLARSSATLAAAIQAKNVAGTHTITGLSSDRKAPWLTKDAAMRTCASALPSASRAVHTGRHRDRMTSAAYAARHAAVGTPDRASSPKVRSASGPA